MKRFTIFTASLIAALALQLNAQITLDLKVFLEGPFNGTTMNTALNVQNLIPLIQPYNVSPWNYSGTEQVGSIPNSSIVDWVLIELRETTGDASTATPDKMINRQAAFIKANGNIVGTDGSSMIGYGGTITSNLYVIIWHRNHLVIMSSAALTNAGGIYSWDFTDQLAKVYLDGQKQLGTIAFGMYGGDSDANGTIETADKYPGWNVNAGTQSYAAVDLNLDSQVNNSDKDNIWEQNLGAITKIPTLTPFGCGDVFIDSRDGQTYNTVQIGTQCWMAENLNIGTMIPGSNEMTNNSIIEKYCFENNTANCDTYGGLYQWNEMMEYITTSGVQGICPANWHLPTDAEWTVLTTFLGGESIAGGKMKATGTLEAGTGLWWDPNTGATNESSFTALPGGYRFSYGLFYNVHNYTYFWSSTEVDSNSAGGRYLGSFFAVVITFNPNKYYGLSSRCVQD
jgi:uncharacterized protein (TIGR02145 family)